MIMCNFGGVEYSWNVIRMLSACLGGLQSVYTFPIFNLHCVHATHSKKTCIIILTKS